jgi:hypothetical protein
MPGTPSSREKHKDGTKEREVPKEEEKNTGSDAIAERGAVAIVARHAVQLATEGAIDHRPLADKRFFCRAFSFSCAINFSTKSGGGPEC